MNIPGWKVKFEMLQLLKVIYKYLKASLKAKLTLKIKVKVNNFQPMYYRTERGDDIQGPKTDIKLEEIQLLVTPLDRACSELSADV